MSSLKEKQKRIEKKTQRHLPIVHFCAFVAKTGVSLIPWKANLASFTSPGLPSSTLIKNTAFTQTLFVFSVKNVNNDLLRITNKRFLSYTPMHGLHKFKAHGTRAVVKPCLIGQRHGHMIDDIAGSDVNIPITFEERAVYEPSTDCLCYNKR